MRRGRFNTSVWTSVKAPALAVSLVAGACMASLAMTASTRVWLEWFALVPLFWAIRVCPPRGALLAGGLWGLLVGLFSTVASGTGAVPSLQSLLLVIVLPGLYAYLAARLTRWVGFSPFVLGVGWVGVELAFGWCGPGHGLLGTTEGNGGILQWVAHALGCVFVAFPVAYANALLLWVVSEARLGGGALPMVMGAHDPGQTLLPRIILCRSRLLIRAYRPRAPPIPGR